MGGIMFKKNLFILLLITFSNIIFGITIPENQLITKNNSTYINLDFLNNLGLNYKKKNDNIIINNITFSKKTISYNNVKVNTLSTILEADPLQDSHTLLGINPLP